MFYRTKTTPCVQLERNTTPFHSSSKGIDKEDQWASDLSEDDDEILDAMVGNMVSTVNTFVFSKKLSRNQIADIVGTVTPFKDASCMELDVQVNYLFTQDCL